MISILQIAALITEDPDVFANDSTSRILTSSEISTKADEIAGDNNAASKQLQDQMKAQQDAEQKEKNERQKLLKPQFQKIDKSINNMQNGLMKNKQNAESTSQQMQNLDTEMNNIRSLLGNVEKLS